MNKTVLLIDGSSLAFLHGNKLNYKETLKDHLEGLFRKYKTSFYILVLEDSKSNFRNKVAVTKEYKGQRRTEKTKQNLKNYLPYLRDVFIEIKEKYKPITCYNVENDDVIAIISQLIDNCVIAANDKDMLAVPGFHHNLRSNKTTYVTLPGTIYLNNKGKVKATGLYQTYFQIIKGSPKENYSGVKGYGDKKVYDLLKDLTTEKEMQKLCINLFKEVYPDDYKNKLEEGFRLCWVIQKSNSFEMPSIIDYKTINNDFK